MERQNKCLAELSQLSTSAPGDGREQVIQTLLIDIRETAHSIRGMLVFFTVLTVIDCLIVLLWVISRLLHCSPRSSRWLVRWCRIANISDRQF
jgi:hypothetical protein